MTRLLAVFFIVELAAPESQRQSGDRHHYYGHRADRHEPHVLVEGPLLRGGGHHRGDGDVAEGLETRHCECMFIFLMFSFIFFFVSMSF